MCGAGLVAAVEEAIADRFLKILYIHEVLQMPQSMAAQVAVEMLMGPQHAADVALIDVHLRVQPWHTQGVTLADGCDAARAMRQVLALVEQRIDVGGVGDEEARDLAPALEKAPIAKRKRKGRRGEGAAQDVGKMLAV